ncbi:LegC family aminotransferase [Cytophagaceae bacterium ABcell3]|nr:LegC family aminotransferase [Cytophagaceae bacterium ABcell3]
MFEEVIHFIKETFKQEGAIPLHKPRFGGNEKKYLLDTIDTTYVSSVGAYVDLFEEKLCMYTGAKHAVAVSSGTSGLHVALKVAGVSSGSVVLTQPFTFVATCNAISYLGAQPYFLDIDKNTLGLSYSSLQAFLQEKVDVGEDGCSYLKESGQKVAACVPVHTYGHPVEIDKITELCSKFGIVVVEDAAESLGSFYKGTHTGRFGKAGVFSFNGNKIITCGGGGAIVTDDTEYAAQVRHLTTQAKKTHSWEFYHDAVGYNYRMPNLNAALAVAQLEQLSTFLKNKRALATLYKDYFHRKGIALVWEPSGAASNFWLNAILLDNHKERDLFLEETNTAGIITRPAWVLMNKLPIFKDSLKSDLSVAEALEGVLVNLPSSVRL